MASSAVQGAGPALVVEASAEAPAVVSSGHAATSTLASAAAAKEEIHPSHYIEKAFKSLRKEYPNIRLDYYYIRDDRFEYKINADGSCGVIKDNGRWFDGRPSMAEIQKRLDAQRQAKNLVHDLISELIRQDKAEATTLIGNAFAQSHG